MAEVPAAFSSFPPPSCLEYRSNPCSSKHHLVPLRQPGGWMALDAAGITEFPTHQSFLHPSCILREKSACFFYLYFFSHCYLNSNSNRYTTQKQINIVLVILRLRPGYRLSRGSSYSIVSTKQAAQWLSWGYETHKSCLSADSPRRRMN